MILAHCLMGFRGGGLGGGGGYERDLVCFEDRKFCFLCCFLEKLMSQMIVVKSSPMNWSLNQGHLVQMVPVIVSHSLI